RLHKWRDRVDGVNLADEVTVARSRPAEWITAAVENGIIVHKVETQSPVACDAANGQGVNRTADRLDLHQRSANGAGCRHLEIGGIDAGDWGTECGREGHAASVCERPGRCGALDGLNDCPDRRADGVNLSGEVPVGGVEQYARIVVVEINTY